RTYFCAPARSQALRSRNTGHVPLHRVRLVQLPGTHAEPPVRRDSTAKVLGGNVGDSAANPGVSQNQVAVRIRWIATVDAERSDHVHVALVDHGDVGDVYHVIVVEATAIPGIIGIIRTHRAPANRSVTDAYARTKANKKYKGRSPQGAIARVNRARPPDPRTLVEEPAAVVIRSPAPRLVRYPGPAIVRLPHPTTGLIGRPCGLLVWLPDLAITGNINPAAVAVQI